MNVQESNWLRQVAQREEQARERWLRSRLAPQNPLYEPEPVPIALPPVQMIGSKVRPVERIDTATMPLAGSRTTDGTPISLEWRADPPYVAPKVGQPRDMYPRWNPRVQAQPAYTYPYPQQAAPYAPEQSPNVQVVAEHPTYDAGAPNTCLSVCGQQCTGACGNHVVSGLVPRTVVSQRVVPITRTVPVRQQTVELQPVLRERTVMQRRTELVSEPVQYSVLVPEQRVQHVHTHTHAAPYCGAAASAAGGVAVSAGAGMAQAWEEATPAPYTYTPAPRPVAAPLPAPLPPHPGVRYAYGPDGVLHRAADGVRVDNYDGSDYTNGVSTYNADYNAGTTPIDASTGAGMGKGTGASGGVLACKAAIEPESTCPPCMSQAALARAIAKHASLPHAYTDCARSTGYPHSHAPLPAPDAPPTAAEDYVVSATYPATPGRPVASRCAVCACGIVDCPGHHNEVIYTRTPTHTAPGRTLYVGLVTKPKGRDVTVLGVRPGSPAHYAGILPNDVIHAVAGVRVDSTELMHKLFELHGQGRRVSGCLPVAVTVRRHGKLVCIMVTPQMKY